MPIGGANLEVFKFGVYMFFPIWMMFKFGDPEWYQTYVRPYREMLLPAYENTNKPPKTQSGLQAELARIKEQRKAQRESRLASSGEQGTESGENVGQSSVQAELAGLGLKGSNGGTSTSDRLV